MPRGTAAAEIRRGKKIERRKKIKTAGQKYNGLPYIFHRAAIISILKLLDN